MYETLKFTEMTTRRVIDAKDKDGEKVYVKGHAKATYMSDGRTVEDAIKQIGTGGGGGGSDGIPLATFTGKIYYYRIYDGGSVKLEWQPCKRLSDGVEGFWDCVTQTFIEPI